MMVMNRFVSAFLLLLVSSVGLSGQVSPEDFRNPPSDARPLVWWHWMDGNISKEGIKKDLEWMDRAGIANEGEVQRSLDPEDPPAVTAFKGIGRNKTGRTDQGFLLIRRTGEYKGLVAVYLRVILQLADGKLFTQNM